MRALLLAAVLTLAWPFRASAFTFASPSFEMLAFEAQKDPASLASAAQAKSEAAVGYDGEGVKGVHILTLKPVVSVEQEPAEPPPVKAKQPRDSYHFEGRQPVKGVNIYTPVKDERGDESTGAPAAPGSPFKKYMRIAGVAAIGLTAAGVFLAPLLFLGGFAAGVYAVLCFLGRKMNK